MPLNKLRILSRFESVLSRFLVNALEKADSDTLKHSISVAELCRLFATHNKEFGLSPDDVWLAGFLHDVGKLGISKDILEKKGSLTKSERLTVERHAIIGQMIAARLFETYKLADAILHHHERHDGKGYPAGLKGDDIPVISRIIAIASSYDSMRSAGWLFKNKSHQHALDEIQNNAGTQFDPDFANAFIRRESTINIAHKKARALTTKEILARI